MITTGANMQVVTAEGLEKAREKLLKKGGRPTKYRDSLAAEICQRLEDGETLTSISKLSHMPSLPTIWDWRGHLPEFANAFSSARKRGASALVDASLDILDNTTPSDMPTVRLAEAKSKQRLEIAKVVDRESFGPSVKLEGQVTFESMADRIRRLTGTSVVIPEQFQHLIED